MYLYLLRDGRQTDEKTDARGRIDGRNGAAGEGNAPRILMNPIVPCESNC